MLLFGWNVSIFFLKNWTLPICYTLIGYMVSIWRACIILKAAFDITYKKRKRRGEAIFSTSCFDWSKSENQNMCCSQYYTLSIITIFSSLLDQSIYTFHTSNWFFSFFRFSKIVKPLHQLNSFIHIFSSITLFYLIHRTLTHSPSLSLPLTISIFLLSSTYLSFTSIMLLFFYQINKSLNFDRLG